MAYTPPSDHTVIVVGGLGNQSAAASDNGGGAEKDVWDANSPSDFIGTNGAPVDTCAAGTIDIDVVSVRITSAGNFTNTIAGTLAYVLFDGEVTYQSGIYQILRRTDNSITINRAHTSDVPTADVNVGGAIDTLQNALDNSATDATSLYNRYIYTNLAETLTAAIDIDTNSGGSLSKIFVIGYNSTLAAEAEVTLTQDGDVNSIFQTDGTQTDYQFRNLDLNAGGKDASKGLYCVGESGAVSRYFVWIDCVFRGAESHGVNHASDFWLFVGCEFTLNGGNGFEPDGADGLETKLINCSFHDNDLHGANINNSACLIFGCFFYDNGKDSAVGDGLIVGGTGDRSSIIGNTTYNNFGDGFNISSTADRCVIANNASVSNGGYGYNLNGTETRVRGFFGNNLAAQNTTAHYSEGADNTFATFANGNNIASAQAADAIFDTITDGSENFTPETGSDLIDNALDAGTA